MPSESEASVDSIQFMPSESEASLQQPRLNRVSSLRFH
jgi:hypothetical protein